jgi:hypothetical protein
MTLVRPEVGGGWTLWPHVLVRGAGFPFALLDEAFRAADPAAALRRVAGDPRFREAVTWQNRQAVEHALDPLRRQSPDVDNARTRKRQRLVAKYLQRYCAKNDTIGFFGPIGWAITGGAPHFEAGASLVSARATFFEPWAVLELARAERRGKSGLDAPVRLRGNMRSVGATLVAPTGSWPLTDDERRAVRAADGRSAAALLRRLSRAAPRKPWPTVLIHLVQLGVLSWDFPVASSLEPDRPWRAIAGSSALDAFVDRRDAVARAAGDPIALDSALQDLERFFASQTGVPATRHQGQMYAGRGLVFEECRRAIALDLGQAPIARIAPALNVVLRIARWYTFGIATRLAAAFLAAHREMGGRRVPLPRFLRDTSTLFDEECPPVVAAMATRLRARWNRLWAHAETRDGAQHLDIATARTAVDRFFRAPCPGWPGARHHAPDLMWSASSPEAMLRAEGTPILAELHPGVSPFTTLSVLSLCPVRDALADEWRKDFPGALVSPIPWEIFARSSLDARLAADHVHLDLGGEFVSDREPHQVRRAADFDVVADGDRLVAVDRRRGPTLDLLHVCERRIKLRAAIGFSLADNAECGPRRYLGPLLIQRAHRRVDTHTLLQAASRGDTQLDAWRTARALPERAFVRSPRETKPIYVDFRSTVSVDMLIRLARQTETLSIAEMYPDPDGLWLRDAAGRSYTSELRFMAVDPEPFDGGQVWTRAARVPQ